MVMLFLFSSKYLTRSSPLVIFARTPLPIHGMMVECYEQVCSRYQSHGQLTQVGYPIQRWLLHGHIYARLLQIHTLNVSYRRISPSMWRRSLVMHWTCIVPGNCNPNKPIASTDIQQPQKHTNTVAICRNPFCIFGWCQLLLNILVQEQERVTRDIHG